MAAAATANPVPVILPPAFMPTSDSKLDTAASTSTALATGSAVRLACRSNRYTAPTSGLAPSHLQANLIILPSRYASDFRLLCARNPVPCPLIAESSSPGSFDSIISHLPVPVLHATAAGSTVPNLDIRTDAPRYIVYRDGHLVAPETNPGSGATAASHRLSIVDEWTADHVAFLIGCSLSFETALARAGLPARHVPLRRNVPMYRASRLPLLPAGVFGRADSGSDSGDSSSCYVVSMRPYRRRDVPRVREVTRPFRVAHGEPLDWGWAALDRLGIRCVDEPEWGDPPLMADGVRAFGEARRRGGSEDDDEDEDEEVPVFWGCGVTPQEAVMRAGLEGTVMAHAPGHMLVLDVKDSDIVQM